MCPDNVILHGGGVNLLISVQQTNTIYLVRHGENTANITKEFSFKLVDYSLTAKGVQQAEQTAEYFKDKDIHEIYSSPLKRAVETAEIIGRELGLAVTVMEQFREVNVGRLEGQPPTQENWALHNRIVEDWYEGRYTSTFPDGENYLAVMQRMREGLLEVTRNKQGRNIVIVGHGGIFTAAVRDLCVNRDTRDLIQKENHNCSITEIVLHTSDGQVEGELKGWALCTHLSGDTARLISGVPQFEK